MNPAVSMDDTPKESKVATHRKMRSLGMGKHTAGNAKSMDMHDVPGAVTVGETKTLGQWRAERKQKKKRKNKLAKQSRKKNRRR